MGVRKNQATLTEAERAAFVAAVRALKERGEYDTFVEVHRQAMLFTDPDPAHHGPAFLPWHREYLLRFERALQAIDASVNLPYWEWTTDSSPSSSLWSADFMGGDGDGPENRVTTGPFAGWELTVLDPGETRRFLRRALGANPSERMPSVDDVRRAIDQDRYDTPPWDPSSRGSFRNTLELRPLHNSVHNWVGGSMAAASSPNDPVFWLHHANVDRVWAIWQRQHATAPYVPRSGTPGAPRGHGHNDPMPPWDDDPDAPTPTRMLDLAALGYEYDSYEIGGPPALAARGPAKRAKARRMGRAAT